MGYNPQLRGEKYGRSGPYGVSPPIPKPGTTQGDRGLASLGRRPSGFGVFRIRKLPPLVSGLFPSDRGFQERMVDPLTTIGRICRARPALHLRAFGRIRPRCGLCPIRRVSGGRTGRTGEQRRETRAVTGTGAGLGRTMQAGLGPGDPHDKEGLGANLPPACTGAHQVRHEVSHGPAQIAKAERQPTGSLNACASWRPQNRSDRGVAVERPAPRLRLPQLPVCTPEPELRGPAPSPFPAATGRQRRAGG
jgi:hypothetical protein